MNPESAVTFATQSRLHMGLEVKNLEASRTFYSKLLGVEPTKEKPGYVRFESESPPINLALYQSDGSHLSHFGIQVKSTGEVASRAKNLRLAGLDVEEEKQVSCCYALQDKVWVQDPDGNPWEVYVVLNDKEEKYGPGKIPGACKEKECC